jgi:O-antigen/teichoic acid export membrane protein
MNAVVHSAIARILSLLPIAIATFLVSRLLLSHYDILVFDGYTLAASLIALVPLNNLGVGAAVTNSVVTGGAKDEHVQRVALTAARTVALSAIGLAVAAMLVSVTGSWGRLLGHGSGPTSFFGLAMVIYAVSFIPGISQSVLLGVNRNHVAILVQSLLAPLTLLTVGALIVLDVDGRYVILIPASVIALVNLVTAYVSARITGFPWLQLLRRLPWRNRYPGARIRAMSGPMLLINLSLPIALQSDRIVLSHFASPSALANFAVAVQIFAPVGAVIIAAAQPLWPMYTVARNEGRHGPSIVKVVGAFSAGCLLVAAPLCALAAPLGHLIGGDRIQLGVLLPIVAALAVIVQAISYPMAMAMMDPKGLRFVAACALVALPLNIVLSIALARSLGAPGPLLASCVVGLVVQVIPGALYLRRRTRLAEAAAAWPGAVPARGGAVPQRGGAVPARGGAVAPGGGARRKYVGRHQAVAVRVSE